MTFPSSPVNRQIRRLANAGWLLVFAFVGAATLRAAPATGQERSVRTSVLLDSAWRTAMPGKKLDAAQLASPGFDDSKWKTVDVPHNWDDYYGYRQIRNGNLHGTAWYRRSFVVPDSARGRRVFLYFEGVGSYAAVWVNGHPVGTHAGGLTTFTLDITDSVHFGSTNLVAVRASEPRKIRDLPWVSGGDERAYGFAEGSQPLGIFRPVHLVVTNPVRIQPFGIHVWNGRTISSESALAHVTADIRNYGPAASTVSVATKIIDADGKTVATGESTLTLNAGEQATTHPQLLSVDHPHLWSPDHPYLYSVQTALIKPDGEVLDIETTAFGFRTVEWPSPGDPNPGRLLINGHPFFINGICEYSHMIGDSHAFSAELIRARVRQLEAAGFNAFRDAHYPHNLRYQKYWEKDGLLWWPQFSAHIWFDNTSFKKNFKSLLADWVRERRNNPALVLWGLQNESQLPAAFARECTQLIRKLDPTASKQRLVVTCNGGGGTDWNIPQNWSGTYGGDPETYAKDLKKNKLFGEYGAWRSLGLHSEPGQTNLPGYSEEHMTNLLETKVRLAESVRNQACGHFMWLFATHDNPGRDFGPKGEQIADGWRTLDHIGPANNKGLLTIWGEPVDAYYMYRSNYAPVDTQPMVYIDSHTWPDRWTKPGVKSGIDVYSNCDAVELFNDFGHHSLGIRHRHGIGTHFEWNNVDIRYNVLYAEGLRNGKVVARDLIELHHLPVAPHLKDYDPHPADLARPAPGWNYLYRVDCGGPEYTDTNGSHWSADRTYRPGDSWGCISWASRFPGLPPALGSVRRITDPVTGTPNDPLYQTFRYGRQDLRYTFAVPNGDYRVELYFIEPWYGTGGGLDCTGWRLFDVAVNGKTVLHDLDLWKEAGRAHAIRKVVPVRVTNGRLVVSFPRVESYQAVISAIAIATKDPTAKTPAAPTPLIENLSSPAGATLTARSWLDSGDRVYSDRPATLASLPEPLRECYWIQPSDADARINETDVERFRLRSDADVYVAFDSSGKRRPKWLDRWETTGDNLITAGAGSARYSLFRKHFPAGATVVLGPNSISGSSTSKMYLTLVVPSLPPRPPQAVEHLHVDGTPEAAAWHAFGHLRRGDRPYGANGPAITRLPSDLTDCDWFTIPSADRDRPVHARFTVNDSVEVYVALDQQIENRPAWMKSWIRTKHTLQAGTHQFNLWKKRFNPGATVILGENGKASAHHPAMYAVLVRLVRPSTVYSVKQTAVIPGTNGGIEWTIKVGVGDRYGLKIRYRLPSDAPGRVRYEFLNKDDDILCSQDLDLKRNGSKPQVIRLRTCTSVNAGTYRVRLVPVSGTHPEFLDLTVE